MKLRFRGACWDDTESAGIPSVAPLVVAANTPKAYRAEDGFDEAPRSAVRLMEIFRIEGTTTVVPATRSGFRRPSPLVIAVDLTRGPSLAPLVRALATPPVQGSTDVNGGVNMEADEHQNTEPLLHRLVSGEIRGPLPCCVVTADPGPDLMEWPPFPKVLLTDREGRQELFLLARDSIFISNNGGSLLRTSGQPRNQLLLADVHRAPSLRRVLESRKTTQPFVGSALRDGISLRPNKERVEDNHQAVVTSPGPTKHRFVSITLDLDEEVSLRLGKEAPLANDCFSDDHASTMDNGGPRGQTSSAAQPRRRSMWSTLDIMYLLTPVKPPSPSCSIAADAMPLGCWSPKSEPSRARVERPFPLLTSSTTATSRLFHMGRGRSSTAGRLLPVSCVDGVDAVFVMPDEKGGGFTRIDTSDCSTEEGVHLNSMTKGTGLLDALRSLTREIHSGMDKPCFTGTTATRWNDNVRSDPQFRLRIFPLRPEPIPLPLRLMRSRGRVLMEKCRSLSSAAVCLGTNGDTWDSLAPLWTAVAHGVARGASKTFRRHSLAWTLSSCPAIATPATPSPRARRQLMSGLGFRLHVCGVRERDQRRNTALKQCSERIFVGILARWQNEHAPVKNPSRRRCKEKPRDVPSPAAPQATPLQQSTPPQPPAKGCSNVLIQDIACDASRTDLAPAYEIAPPMAKRNRIGVRQAGVCVEGRGIGLTALMERKAATGDRLQSRRRRRPTRAVVRESMTSSGTRSGFYSAQAWMSQDEEEGSRTVQRASSGFDCGVLASSPLRDPRQAEQHCPHPSAEAVNTALSTLKRNAEEEAVKSNPRHPATHRSADAKPQIVGVEECESYVRDEEPFQPSPQKQQTTSSPDACPTRAQPSPPLLGNRHGSVVLTLPPLLEPPRNLRDFEPISCTSASGSKSGAVSSREEITSHRGEEITFCDIIAAAGGKEGGQQQEKTQHVPSHLNTGTTVEAHMNAMALPSPASTTPPTTATLPQKVCGEDSDGDHSRSKRSEDVSSGAEMEALTRRESEGLATNALGQVTAGAAAETDDDPAMRACTSVREREMLIMLRAGNIRAAANLATGGDGSRDHHIAGWGRNSGEARLPSSAGSELPVQRRQSYPEGTSDLSESCVSSDPLNASPATGALECHRYVPNEPRLVYAIVSEEFVSVAGGSTLLALQGEGRRSSSAAGKAQRMSVDRLAESSATVACRGGGDMRCALLELSVQGPVDLVIGSRSGIVVLDGRDKAGGRGAMKTHGIPGVPDHHVGDSAGAEASWVEKFRLLTQQTLKYSTIWLLARMDKTLGGGARVSDALEKLDQWMIGFPCQVQIRYSHSDAQLAELITNAALAEQKSGDSTTILGLSTHHSTAESKRRRVDNGSAHNREGIKERSRNDPEFGKFHHQQAWFLQLFPTLNAYSASALLSAVPLKHLIVAPFEELAPNLLGARSSARGFPSDRRGGVVEGWGAVGEAGDATRGGVNALCLQDFCKAVRFEGVQQTDDCVMDEAVGNDLDIK